MQSGNVTFQARTVAEQGDFLTRAAAIFGDAERADDALRGLVTAISYSPVTAASHLVQQGPPPLYAIKTIGTGHWPAVVVFYSFDATHVFLEGILRSA